MSSLRQDLRLLDAFDRAEPFSSPARLGERLRLLCKDQGLPIDPLRIQRAVSLYLKEDEASSSSPTTPVAPEGVPPVRQMEEAEWETLRTRLSEEKADHERVCDRWGYAISPVCVSAFLATALPLCPNLHGLLDWKSAIHTFLNMALAFAAGSAVFVVVTSLVGTLTAVALRRRPRYRRALALAASATGCSRLRDALFALTPCEPEPSQLRRWLTCPDASAYLQKRVLQAVPLLNQDAEALEKMVEHTDDARDRAQLPWSAWVVQQRRAAECHDGG